MFLPLALCSGFVEVALALFAPLAAFGTFIDVVSFKAFSHLVGSDHLSQWFHFRFGCSGLRRAPTENLLRGIQNAGNQEATLPPT